MPAVEGECYEACLSPFHGSHPPTSCSNSKLYQVPSASCPYTPSNKRAAWVCITNVDTIMPALWPRLVTGSLLMPAYDLVSWGHIHCPTSWSYFWQCWLHASTFRYPLFWNFNFLTRLNAFYNKSSLALDLTKSSLGSFYQFVPQRDLVKLQLGSGIHLCVRASSISCIFAPLLYATFIQDNCGQ